MKQRGPDFLCVGMQKAGTRWLYDCLQGVNGICMMPIKELHHFDRKLVCGEKLQEVQQRRLTRRLHSKHGGLGSFGRRKFRALVKNYISTGCSDEEYLSIFKVKGRSLSGDVTPAYSILKRENVSHVQALLPDAKIVLIIRHPVFRLWSAYNMHLRVPFREKNVSESEIQADVERENSVERLKEFLTEPGAMARAFPSRVFDAWDLYGDQLAVVDFQDIVKRPNDVAEHVATHLLGRPTNLAQDFSLGNRKENHAKVNISDDQKALLFEVFAEELRACSEKFPKIAGDWQLKL